MRDSHALLTLLAASALLAGEGRLTAATPNTVPLPARQAVQAPKRVALPFTLDHNRMIVEAEFVRPDGTVRTARAWVDMGNQYFLLGEPLARELGLAISGEPEAGTQYAIVEATGTPQMSLGEMPIDTQGIKTKVVLGARTMPGVPAEANVPASALRGLNVVLNYPRRILVIGGSASRRPQGVAIPCRINPETGLLQITATIDGTPADLGVDNGSAYTWVSQVLTTTWRARHPQWPHVFGATGAANFFGFGFEVNGVLMRLPGLGIGPLRVSGVGLLGLDQGLFDWFSTKTAGPVLGILGANVLKGFRLEIDPIAAMTYWQRGAPPDGDDLDIVPLTLRPESDGSLTIVGVVRAGDRTLVTGIQAGDKLIKVDSLTTPNATMGTVIDSLRGRPGARHALLIERRGTRLEVIAPVVRLP